MSRDERSNIERIWRCDSNHYGVKGPDEKIHQCPGDHPWCLAPVREFVCVAALEQERKARHENATFAAEHLAEVERLREATPADEVWKLAEQYTDDDRLLLILRSGTDWLIVRWPDDDDPEILWGRHDERTVWGGGLDAVDSSAASPNQQAKTED